MSDTHTSGPAPDRTDPSSASRSEGSPAVDSAPPRTFSVETRSYEYVPESARFGSIRDQQKLWFMVNTAIITVLAGGIGSIFGLGLFWNLIAILVGSLVGTVFQALHAAQGPIMGIPQMIQSRVQFGSRGALIPLVAVVVVLCGFSVFLVQSSASALSTFATVDLQTSQVVIAAIAVTIAILGYRLLLVLERVMAYVTFVNFVFLTIAVLVTLPWATAVHGGWTFTITGFLAQFGASAMLQLGAAPQVSDYTRYLPTRTSGAQITSAVFGGTLISALWLSFLGSLVIAAFPDGDMIVSLRHLGDDFGFKLGLITMIVAVPAALMPASTALYSSSVSALTAGEAFRHFTTTKQLRAGVLSTMGVIVIVTDLLLPADLLGSFSAFLALLGCFLVPWTAINLVDFYFIRKGTYSITDILKPDGGIYGQWSRPGLVSYAIGFLAMVPFVSTSLYTGPIAKVMDGADISFVVGLVVSIALYIVQMRTFDLAAYRSVILQAPIHSRATAHWTGRAR